MRNGRKDYREGMIDRMMYVDDATILNSGVEEVEKRLNAYDGKASGHQLSLQREEQ